MKNIVKPLSLLIVTALVVVSSCKKEDNMDPTGNNPVASFQYAIDTDNWAKVIFSNFSDNADSYAWDFGDGNSSTEESPTHTYAEAGPYTVSLVATGNGTSNTKTESFMITDPDEAATFLSGTAGKTWYLRREGIALGIGSAPNDNSFWSFGGDSPLGDRPCILDDSYTFHPDGTWEMNTNNTLFIDADANGGWLGQPEGCHDESEAGVFTGPAGEDLSAFANGGSYTYDFDAAASSITINGLGAYIGLAPKTESGDNFVPTATKTYQMFNMAEGAVADTLDLAIVALDGSFAWNFYMVSYDNISDLPAIPSAMPTAGYTYVKNGNEVVFTNTSVNSTSYSWDFGDGNSSIDENPTHTYAADGDYTVVLTAMDGGGQSDDESQVVSISSAVFTGAELSNAAGKVWKLDGEGSYFVGPCPGCGDWWPGIDAAGVIERACQLDDEFTFFDNGTMEINTMGMVWSEDYLGGTGSCIADTDLMSPFDVFAGGTHSFSATAADVTVNGLGAYIGFNRPFNQGELPGDATGTPVSTITYQVLEYSNNAGVERITISIDYTADASGYWNMRMISQ